MSINEFGRAVIRSKLLNRATLTEYAQEFLARTPEGKGSARGFASFLIARGRLTRYQAARLLAGRTEGFFLGGCKILDCLGAGGMGKVYLAEQLSLGRQVAVKVLPSRVARDADNVARFQREARAAAGLKHPNIVQVIDVGTDGTRHYILMELVRGMNLKERVRKQGPLSVADSLEIIKQVASGLEHAHENGIVHRDIKPSNLILEAGAVKILDLGLARITDSGESLTEEGRGLGTPDYVSPEQIIDARTADIRSDLYSLGCTWYHLLTGRPPFSASAPVGKAMAHVHKSPEPIQRLVPSLPDGFAGVLAKLMAKRPEDRFQSPSQLLSALNDCNKIEDVPTISWAPRLESDLATTPDEPSSDPLSPLATSEDEETVVRRPTPQNLTLLLYLLPLMGALVLGGVYIGIRHIREQLPVAAPVLMDVQPSHGEKAPEDARVAPPDPAEPSVSSAQKPKGEETDPPGPGSRSEDVAAKTAPPEEPSASQSSESSDDAEETTNTSHHTAPTTRTIPKQVPANRDKRAPQVVTVGPGNNISKDFENAWRQAGDNDRIEIASGQLIRAGPLTLEGNRLSLVSNSRERPILLLTLPEDNPEGKGIWQITRGGLRIEGIDLYIDLRDRNVIDHEVVLLDAFESDLEIVDSSITVVSGAVSNRTRVAAVRVKGERPWDPKSLGEAPAPIRVYLRNSMIRGPQTAFYVDSRQARLFLENSIVCSSGTLLHLFHVRPFEFAHHKLRLEAGDCTFDLGGALCVVECRPYELAVVPLEISLRSSVVAVSPTGAAKPPQVLWQSPVSSEALSVSVHWSGQENCYLQRGDALQAKTQEGPIATFVQSPGDWHRLGLGLETNSTTAETGFGLQSPWHVREPRNYMFRALSRRFTRAQRTRNTELPGVEIKSVPVPRSLPRTR